jgi:glyoxylase-like metal-dependent hydrolase (beta-lactamase superfamily II)
VGTKTRSALIASTAAFLSATTAGAQGINYDKTFFTTQQLAPNFYTLTGAAGTDPGHPEAAGGRIGVLVGSDGVLMVDASYAPLSDKIAEAIRKITPAPIRYLVDTHWHPDHTGGNPNFARLGAVILAREELWHELGQPQPPAVLAAVGNAASFTDPDRFPAITFSMGSLVKIRMDGEVIDLIPVAAAHTDGDTVVRFENANVIMIGDFYRNYGYPFIDASHGGTFKGVLEALDVVGKLAGPTTTLVPGHGAMITRADLASYRAMIVDVEARVQQLIDHGSSLKEVLAAKLTAPYDRKVRGSLDPLPSLPSGFGTSADRFVGTVYAELKSGQ